MPSSKPPVPLILTGVMAGKTAIFCGFRFIEGRATLTGEEFDAIGHVLERHHAAIPVDRAEREGLLGTSRAEADAAARAAAGRDATEREEAAQKLADAETEAAELKAGKKSKAK